MRVARRRSLLLALVALALPVSAVAQWVPSKPIVIVVPYTAGSAPDLLGRILAEKLAPALGQPVRVENRPGATGNVGAMSVAQSAPDGHTLLVADNALLTISPFVYRHATFDATRDLAPVSGLVESSLFFLVNAGLPVSTLQEFVEFARRASPPLAYATVGVGSAFHLAVEQFRSQAGVDLLHVPYKGSSQAALAAANGEVAFLVAGKSAEPFVLSGKLRALATTGVSRPAAHPDLPTVNEHFPGVQLSIWQGLFAPAATPAAVIERLDAEVGRILDMPDVQRQLASANDLRPLGMTRAQFADRISREREGNRALVKRLGVALD